MSGTNQPTNQPYGTMLEKKTSLHREREANRNAVGYILIFQFLTKLLIMYTIIDFSYEESAPVINNQSVSHKTGT